MLPEAGTVTWDDSTGVPYDVTLSPSVTTRALRLLPQTATSSARMRFEIYGCVAGAWTFLVIFYVCDLDLHLVFFLELLYVTVLRICQCKPIN